METEWSTPEERKIFVEEDNLFAEWLKTDQSVAWLAWRKQRAEAKKNNQNPTREQLTAFAESLNNGTYKAHLREVSRDTPLGGVA